MVLAIACLARLRVKQQAHSGYEELRQGVAARLSKPAPLQFEQGGQVRRLTTQCRNDGRSPSVLGCKGRVPASDAREAGAWAHRACGVPERNSVHVQAAESPQPSPESDARMLVNI